MNADRERKAWKCLSRPIFGLIFGAALFPVTARSEELSGSVTLYGWLPWMELDTTTDRGYKSSASVSAGDVLDALEFAFFAAGEVHYGRFGLLHDTVFAKLGESGSLSGPLSSKIDVDLRMLMVTNALSYQVYGEDGYIVEPFAGARYVMVETDVKIKGGGPVGVSRNASVDADWWDPVVGIRGRVPLTEKLSAAGFFDIGGFGAGSEFTWEVFAGLDYAISDRFSAIAGFRYISIEYDSKNGDIDLAQYGPVLGVTLRF
jgi:opacity protein-like surface antigen